MSTYVRAFESESKAISWMRMKNRSARLAGNTRDVFCVVDGPSDDWAVVDIATAVDLGAPYRWEA